VTLVKEILSFVLYLLLLGIPFVLYLLFPAFWRRYRALFYFVAYLPVAIFAALRGNVGTDTENYRDAYELFDAHMSPQFSIDYLFNFLIYICKVLGLGFQGFSAVHASLCLLLFSYGAGRIDKVAPVLGLGLLPVLIIDATFNGLRYGLAFAAAAACIHLYHGSSSRLRFGFLVVPGLIHSSLLPLLVLAPVMLVFAVAYLSTIDLESLLYFSFFADKAESYSEFQRPSGFSGLVPVILFCILFVINLINKNTVRIGFNLGFIALGIFLSGVLVASQSYAGLRIMQVGVFLFAINVARTVQPEFESKTAKLAVLLGLIGVLNFLRQIFLVGPDGGVVFHPYVFH
jgi:hypothetical protein